MNDTITPTQDALPTLYHQAKTGKIHSWRVWTEGAEIVTEHGQVDGEKQTARKRATPKNVGRSNETTAEEQALLEAKSMWQKKRDHKYHLTPEEAVELQIRPMLADSFEKRLGKNVTFPAHIQPKLDGMRALAYWDGDKVEILSRSGKSYRDIGSVEHIAKAIEQVLPQGMLLDGEIYAAGLDFQTNTKLLKKYRPGDSEALALHAYDLIDLTRLEQPWSERHQNLLVFSENFTPGGPLEVVPTEAVASEDEVYERHAAYLEQGFEGAIVRLLDAPYELGKRSNSLLKVKNFQDEEFKIISVSDGVGKFEGKAVFKCLTPEGREFDVTPKGTMEERAAMFEQRDTFIGQLLKVQFFEKTQDGIPRFPVGLGVRMPEDLEA